MEEQDGMEKLISRAKRRLEFWQGARNFISDDPLISFPSLDDDALKFWVEHFHIYMGQQARTFVDEQILEESKFIANQLALIERRGGDA